jgi:CheY-like chemotaxis protein
VRSNSLRHPPGLDVRQDARHRLATAGQCLLLSVRPVRHPESRLALGEFVRVAASCSLLPAETDVVLLRLLAALDPITGTRLPSLVDRYVLARRGGAAPLTEFWRCVDGALRYRGIGDPLVQRAIAVIEDQSSDPYFGAAAPAKVLDVSQVKLCAHFKRQSGVTIGTYIREFRLDRAAAKLVRTHLSIKAVWIEVGYRHASNFNHDFKERFGLTPANYRSKAIADGSGTSWRATSMAAGAAAETGEPCLSKGRKMVLVVDDDKATRETLVRVLGGEGFEVVVSETGRDGLRRALRLRPDTILLDYWLGDMDGLTWLRALRSQMKGPSSKVTVWSADCDLDIAREVAALGATYVEKCCDVEELKRHCSS